MRTIRVVALVCALVLAVLSAFTPQFALSQTYYTITPSPRQQFLTAAGAVLANGTLETFECGTSTPKAAYSDNAGTALPTTIALNSAGRPQTGAGAETAIYLANSCYKFVAKNAGGVTQWTQDNVSDIGAILKSDIATQLLTKNLNNVRFANQFTGATWDAKVRAAIADLPAAGGTVDARGLEGAQSIVATVTLDRPVSLIIGNATLTAAIANPFLIPNGADGSQIRGCGPLCTVITYTGAGYVFDTQSAATETTPQTPRNVSISDLRVNASGNALGVLRVGRTTTAYSNSNFRLFWRIENIYALWSGATKANSAAFSFTQMAAGAFKDIWLEGGGAGNNWDYAVVADRGTVNSFRHWRTQSDTVGFDWNCVNPDASLVTGGINDWLMNAEIGVSKAAGVGIRTDCQFINIRDTFLESPGGVVIAAFIQVLANGNVFSADNVSYAYSTAPTYAISLAAATAPTYWTRIVDQSGAAPANFNIGAVAGGERHNFIGCSRWVNYSIAGAAVGAFTPADPTFTNTMIFGQEYSGATGFWRLGAPLTISSAVTLNAAMTQTGNYTLTGNFTGTGQFQNTGQAYLIQSTSNATNLTMIPSDDANPTAQAVHVRNAANSTTHWAVQKNGLIVGLRCASSASPATCGASWAGSVNIPAGGTTITVNTTVGTANSQILITEDSSLGTLLGVTCNTTLGREYAVTARTPGTSFVITTDAAPAVNPACLSYLIIN